MKIRRTQPKNNKYYIRRRSGGWSDAVAGSPTISGADVLCNCVGYANGRFAEIQGLGYIKYQLVCNAENFIERAKAYGLRISPTPVQGGIMVWQKGRSLADCDGAGHVAVVEEVYKDGSIMTSESGWASWAFKLVRRDNTNGRWGQSELYRFRGCIVNPGVKDPDVVPAPKLAVDGVAGPATVRALQGFLGTPQDGVISGQSKELHKYYPAVTAVTYGKGGSAVVRALQKWTGTKVDGIWGQGTTKALQRKLGVVVDGVAGPATVRALQKMLNGDEKRSGASAVIDVSEFQPKRIDWRKVKASGVDGVIIRCGYRGAEKGTLHKDAHFDDYIKGAHAAGLKVGVYMFTEAITAKEGREEAAFALNLIKAAGIPLAYPVAIDSEAVNVKGERARGLTKAKRTAAIKGFCQEIKKQGYEPMVYASTSWLNGKLDMSKLPYKVWCAQYAPKCEYKGNYIMWQYTSTGRVPGIDGNVDMNKFYDTEPGWVERVNAWAKRIAGDNSFHYVKWSSDKKTHECPICHDHPAGPYRGWNCIGFAFACWHHGGGIPCRCNCHVISSEVAEQIAGAKTDAEALKIAQDRIGIKDIEVIRNAGKDIPKSKWKAGDIGMKFSGKVYKHTFYYMGGDKIADASGRGGDGSKDIAVRSYADYTARVIIRYIGK